MRFSICKIGGGEAFFGVENDREGEVKRMFREEFTVNSICSGMVGIRKS